MTKTEMQGRIEVLEKVIQDTFWCARRYAHGRSTYSPGMVRDAYHALERLGIKIKYDDVIKPPIDGEMVGMRFRDDYLDDTNERGVEGNEVLKMTKSKYVSVSATGECIMNYAVLPTELNGWRRSRLEYGGHAERCFMEQIIYYPPDGNDYIFDLLFDLWQTKRKVKKNKIFNKIVAELKKGMK